jgi:hypothetical protein
MNLRDAFVTLKRNTGTITTNPLLDSFDMDELEHLDAKASEDQFISEKKKNILNLIKPLGIDFDDKLKGAYGEYSEGLAYLRIKEKSVNIVRIPEATDKTPDFRIEFSANNNGKQETFELFVELKTLSFADGKSNYKRAMDEALAGKIRMEDRLEKGDKVVFSEIVIQPMRKSNKQNDALSTRYAIEFLIDKIDQNIKPGQFVNTPTILMIDLKQFPVPYEYGESAVPIYHQFGMPVSGILWNVAFGKVGHLMYKPIDFEGSENTDGELERNGILIGNVFIAGMIFFVYSLNETKPRTIGFQRLKSEDDAIEFFFSKVCDFTNKDGNTNGCSDTKKDKNIETLISE